MKSRRHYDRLSKSSPCRPSRRYHRPQDLCASAPTPAPSTRKQTSRVVGRVRHIIRFRHRCRTMRCHTCLRTCVCMRPLRRRRHQPYSRSLADARPSHIHMAQVFVVQTNVWSSTCLDCHVTDARCRPAHSLRVRTMVTRLGRRPCRFQLMSRTLHSACVCACARTHAPPHWNGKLRFKSTPQHVCIGHQQ